MQAALFLDVDGVVTTEPVQLQLAKMLGVHDDFRVIEEAYCQGTLTAAQFDAAMIPLFRSKGFTKQYARHAFQNITVHPWAIDFFEWPADIFLVSMGPNYFVDSLAQAFSIAPARVLCTRYAFGQDGLLEKCVQPVTYRDKYLFVKAHADKYKITVGIGDDAHSDGPFLSLCTIPILSTQYSRGMYQRVLQYSKNQVLRQAYDRHLSDLSHALSMDGHRDCP